MKLISNITIENAQAALDLTAEIIDETGPRLTGTESCKRAGELLGSYLDKICDNIYSEKFQCSRDAFLFHVRYLSISYILAFIFLCIGGSWNYGAAAVTIIGCLIVLFEFVFYFEFIDIFFRKTQGQNISGIMEPDDKVKQQVIISGHYDSPYVFSFLNKYQRLYKFRITLNSILYLLITGLSVWFAYKQFINIDNNILSLNLFIILGIGVFFIGQYFFFIGWEVSPGAGDNLVSACMVVKLSELFYNMKPKGLTLKHTRLVFLCPDAEESGLRGSREYVKKHNQTLKSIPTFSINLDSIYRLQDLRFLKSELNGSMSLDIGLREQCNDIAKSLGYKIKSIKMPFGGGSTDAAEFAKAGIPALSIIGVDTTFSSGNVPYHTQFDTVDKIEPQAVLACMQIAEQFILKIDKSSV